MSRLRMKTNSFGYCMWQFEISISLSPTDDPITVAALPKASVCCLYAYWDCGLESRRGHEGLTFASVVCCQVEVSAMSWSLVQSSPTECGVSVCVWSWNLDNWVGGWWLAHYLLLCLGKKIPKDESGLPLAILQRCIVSYKLLNYLL